MKRIGIEALLAWAYRQELPKAQRERRMAATPSNWSVMARYAETLATIDVSPNQWGVVADEGAMEDPHPDAIVVYRAVSELARLVFEPWPGYDVLGDVVLADGSTLTDAEREDCHARGVAVAQINGGRMPGVVARFAILGRFPEWRVIETPVRKAVRGPNGKDAWFRMVECSGGEGRPTRMVEADGFDRAKRRPHHDAYRKMRLVPDPARLVSDRAEYQAMVLALAALAADLDGRLACHAVDGPARTLWPWREGRTAQGDGAAFTVNFAGDCEDTHRRAGTAA